MSRDDTLDAALDAIARHQHRNESLHRHPLTDEPCSYCTLAATNALRALKNAGFRVVRVDGDGIRHGDTLTEYEWQWEAHGLADVPVISASTELPDDPAEVRLFAVRSSVPSQPEGDAK